MTSLDLSYNCLCGLDEVGDGTYDASGIIALAGALRVNAVLTNLNVGGNVLGPEGGKAFAAALQVNRVLTRLDLRYNSLGAEGTQLLRDVVSGRDAFELLV